MTGPGASPVRDRRALLFLAWLLPVILGLPFIGRAFFVDDHYQVLMARGILERPLRPYDFRADDAGPDNPAWERGRPPRMVNPPVHHYGLALLWKAGGGRLWVLRLGCLLFSALSAVFVYLLACRFLVPPGPAAVWTALAPAFWLSSYSLLIDSTMLTFFLGGLCAWIEGLHRGKLRLLVLAGVLMGLTILTKYTGAFVVPLAAAYWWIGRRGANSEFRMTNQGSPHVRRLLFLLIPLLMLGLWGLWNAAAYGESHLMASSRRVMQSFAVSHVLLFLTFLGGVFLFPLLAWTWVPRRILGLSLAAAVLLAVFLAGPRGGFPAGQAALMAALAVGAGLFLLAVAEDRRRVPVPSDGFLLLWLLIGALQMIFVMQWVAARYYLTLLPPAVFLALRSLKSRHAFSPAAFNRGWTIAAAGLFVFGLALAAADRGQAAAQARAAEDVKRDAWEARGGRRFYLGDSFTASYMKYAGWTPAFPGAEFHPGDVVLRQEVVMPAWWFRPAGRWRALKAYAYPGRLPLRVMDNRGGAGFYASAWGALPFAFSREPLERYVLWELMESGPEEAPALPSGRTAL